MADPTTEVTVFRNSPDRLVKEGDSVEIKCQGNGNPQPVKSFTHNNVRILFFFQCWKTYQNIL